VVLEKAKPQGSFVTAKNYGPNSSGYFKYQEEEGPVFTRYRLKIVHANGSYFYSPLLDTKDQNNSLLYNSIWPNPAKDKITIQLSSSDDKKIPYFIHNVQGTRVLHGWLQLHKGINRIPLDIGPLTPGLYQIRAGENKAVSLKFVKH
jgi:hypothetical protein